MEKNKKSKPAIFMYCVIAITLMLSIICLGLYYCDIYKNAVLFWTGVTSFTIMYHFWVRIIMGNVSKLFKKHIKYNQRWFKERKIEKKLYKTLRVKEMSVLIIMYYVKKCINKSSIKNEILKERKNEQIELLKLKNYINKYSLIKNRDLESVIVWDEYLAYATAFGIPNKVTNTVYEVGII